MHPRYRRALIPVLLVGLLVVVLVAALAREAGADEPAPAERVSTITDRRIPESSALVMSTRHPSLAYTVNDSGNAPVVYAIKVSTGRVVSATTLEGYEITDVEALAIDRSGTLWVADIGDNNGVRHDLALYAIDQPGRRDGSVEPERFRLRYSDGSQDAETLLADPSTGAMYVVSKGFLGGQVYRLPDRLSSKHENVMKPVKGVEAPVLVTDGGFLPDGSRVLLRSYRGVYSYDSKTWEPTWSAPLPKERQGESLAVEPDGESILIGTEGLPSPLLRVGLPGPGRATPLAPVGGVISAGS